MIAPSSPIPFPYLPFMHHLIFNSKFYRVSPFFFPLLPEKKIASLSRELIAKINCYRGCGILPNRTHTKSWHSEFSIALFVPPTKPSALWERKPSSHASCRSVPIRLCLPCAWPRTWFNSHLDEHLMIMIVMVIIIIIIKTPATYWAQAFQIQFWVHRIILRRKRRRTNIFF